MKAQTFKQWLAEGEEHNTTPFWIPEWGQAVTRLPEICQVTIDYLDKPEDWDNWFRELCSQIGEDLEGEALPLFGTRVKLLNSWITKVYFAYRVGEKVGREFKVRESVEKVVRLYGATASIVNPNIRTEPQNFVSQLVAWNEDELTAEDLLILDKLLDADRSRDPWVGRLRNTLKDAPNWPEDKTDWALGDW